MIANYLSELTREEEFLKEKWEHNDALDVHKIFPWNPDSPWGSYSSAISSCQGH